MGDETENLPSVETFNAVEMAYEDILKCEEEQRKTEIEDAIKDAFADLSDFDVDDEEKDFECGEEENKSVKEEESEREREKRENIYEKEERDGNISFSNEREKETSIYIASRTCSDESEPHDEHIQSKRKVFAPHTPISLCVEAKSPESVHPSLTRERAERERLFEDAEHIYMEKNELLRSQNDDFVNAQPHTQAQQVEALPTDSNFDHNMELMETKAKLYEFKNLLCCREMEVTTLKQQLIASEERCKQLEQKINAENKKSKRDVLSASKHGSSSSSSCSSSSHSSSAVLFEVKFKEKRKLLHKLQDICGAKTKANTDLTSQKFKNYFIEYHEKAMDTLKSAAEVEIKALCDMLEKKENHIKMLEINMKQLKNQLKELHKKQSSELDCESIEREIERRDAALKEKFERQFSEWKISKERQLQTDFEAMVEEKNQFFEKKTADMKVKLFSYYTKRMEEVKKIVMHAVEKEQVKANNFHKATIKALQEEKDSLIKKYNECAESIRDIKHRETSVIQRNLELQSKLDSILLVFQKFRNMYEKTCSDHKAECLKLEQKIAAKAEECVKLKKERSSSTKESELLEKVKNYEKAVDQLEKQNKSSLKNLISASKMCNELRETCEIEKSNIIEEFKEKIELKDKEVKDQAEKIKKLKKLLKKKDLTNRGCQTEGFMLSARKVSHLAELLINTYREALGKAAAVMLANRAMSFKFIRKAFLMCKNKIRQRIIHFDDEENINDDIEAETSERNGSPNSSNDAESLMNLSFGRTPFFENIRNAANRNEDDGSESYVSVNSSDFVAGFISVSFELISNPTVQNTIP